MLSMMVFQTFIIMNNIKTKNQFFKGELKPSQTIFAFKKSKPSGRIFKKTK